MPWAKFDDKFIGHPKVLGAGPLAVALHMRAIIYSALHLTDGVIRRRQLNHICCWDDDADDFHGDPPRNLELVKRLVNAGLWDEAPDGEGWCIHDYLDWNPSRAEAKALSEVRAEAGRKAGVASGAARRAKRDARTRRTNDEPKRSTSVRESLNETRTKTNPVPVPSKEPTQARCDSATAQAPGEQARQPLVVCTIPLVSGMHEVAQRDVDEWMQAYPGVDVPQQLRAMRQWSLANPTRRKTKRGVRRFIVSWLARQQDSGPRANGGGGGRRRTSFAEVTRAAMDWAHAADDSDGIRQPDVAAARMLPERGDG